MAGAAKKTGGRKGGATRKTAGRAPGGRASAGRAAAGGQHSLAGLAAEARTLREELALARQEVAELRRQVRELLAEARVGAQSARAEASAPERHNRLGVTVARGVVVAEVARGGPAAAAGLTPGDVVAGVNDRAVRTGAELQDAVRGAGSGELVLRVVRGGSGSDVAVRLGAERAGENGDGHNRLGLVVEPGVVVAEVQPGTPASGVLEPGDVILAVDGAEVHGGEQLRAAVERLLPGAEAVLRVSRGGETSERTVRLADPPAGA